MSGQAQRLRGLRASGGAVLVLVALMLPVLIGAGGLVVDVGNWFAHKRHLQAQADAGALAGADTIGSACDWTAIQNYAGTYSSVQPPAGPSYNPQIGATPAANLHREMNKKSFYGQPSVTDDTDTLSPCVSTRPMVDVKLTETNLPWFLRFAHVNFINAQARVEIHQKVASKGSLPIGVPDVGTQKAKAIFVDEASGTAIATAVLAKTGTISGLVKWTGTVSVPINVSKIGVRILLSQTTAANPQCGTTQLVDCYGAGTSASIVAGTPGLVHIRGYLNTPAGTVGSPQPRNVTLAGPSCENGYFTATAVLDPCTVDAGAVVDFGPTPPAVGTTRILALRTDESHTNSAIALTAPATITGTWTGGAIPVARGEGAVRVDLIWQTGCPVNRSAACNPNAANTGRLIGVQRAYAGAETLTNSGPIKLLNLLEPTLPPTNPGGEADSFLRCAAPGCNHDITVTLGLKPTLAAAQSAGDAPVSLKIAGGGSQNQALDCDPNVSNLRDELANGCAPEYKINNGEACLPGGIGTWPYPPPNPAWTCVWTSNGEARGQATQGMNLRVLGPGMSNANAGDCTAQFRNHWSSFPNFPPGDTRIVQVMLAPFGAFTGSGNKSVPVTGFAKFYITGWDQGACQTLGDDVVPSGNQGEIRGHFINYIDKLNNGDASGAFCDLSALGICVATMTR